MFLENPLKIILIYTHSLVFLQKLKYKRSSVDFKSLHDKKKCNR